MNKSDTAVVEAFEVRRSLLTFPSSTSWWAARCLVVVLTLVGCTLTLEIGLRAIGRYQLGPIGSPGYFAPGGVSYRLKKNARKEVIWPGMSFTVNTCELGLRYKETGPCNFGTRPYYALLGSSDVFGNGLNYEKTFAGVLAAGMESDQIDVVNLAVDGHHLLEQVAVFKEFLTEAPKTPDVVLIGLNPLFIGGYDDIHENVAVRHGMLFDKDHWKLPLAKTLLSDSSAAYCFFRDAIRNTQSKYFNREDYSLSFYVERYSTKHPIRTAPRTAEFLSHLRSLEKEIRSLGATPVYFYAPTVGGFLLNDLAAKGEIDARLFDTEFFPELARKHAEAEGIDFIDLEPLLQELYDKGEKLNFQGDAHYNGPTSQKVGEFMYSSLKTRLGSAVMRETQ